MKKFLLFYAVTALTGMSALAYAPSNFVQKGKCYVKILDDYRHEYNGNKNVPIYTHGSIVLDYKIEDEKTQELYLSHFFSHNEVFENCDQATITLRWENGANWKLKGNKGLPTHLSSLKDDEETKCYTTDWIVLYENDTEAYILTPYDTNNELNTQIDISAQSLDANGNIQTTDEGAFAYRLIIDPAKIQKLIKHNGTYKDSNNNEQTGVWYSFDSDDIIATTNGIVYTTYASDDNRIADVYYDIDENGELSNPEQRTYDAKVDMNTDGSISITNLSKLGRAFSFAGSPFEEEGVTSSEIDFIGNFDLDEGTVTLDAAYVSGFYNDSDVYLRVLSGNVEGNTDNSIRGTVEHQNIKHVNGPWIGEGTSGYTAFSQALIKLDDYILATTPFGADANQASIGSKYAVVKNTTMKADFQKEYTAQVKFNIALFGYSQISPDNREYYYWVQGSLDGIENDEYVESYELWMTPFSFRMMDDDTLGDKFGIRIDTEEFQFDNVYSHSTQSIRVLSINNPEFETDVPQPQYNLLIPKSKFMVATENQAGFYVKVNYKEDSKLTPSFHSFIGINQPTITGVEDIVNGEINGNEPSVYYNLNGIRVSESTLTPGIYIRQQGDTSSKVVIH